MDLSQNILKWQLDAVKESKRKITTYTVNSGSLIEAIRDLSSCVWARGCRASGLKADGGREAPHDREAGRWSWAGTDEGPGPTVLVRT